MNGNVQAPAAGQKVYRNTGFPEPFCHERNTTLAHPDADTSPNATIEASDFDLVRTHSRRSLRHGRQRNANHHILRHPLNRSKNSVGATSIGSDLSGLYDNIQYADGSKEERNSKEIESELESREDLVSPPSASKREKKRERQPNDSGVDMNVDGIEEEEKYEEKKKKGLLGKLGL